MTNYKAKPWRFENSAGQLDCYIYGEISSTDDLAMDGGTTALSFLNDLKAAGPVSRIVLHINSPGGSVFAATAIHNTLRASGARVECVIDGLCASAATFVAMAADTIAMPRNAMMMVHLPSVSLFSATADELSKMATVLNRMTDSMVQMYRRHSPLSANQIKQMLQEETWMDGPSALAAGFITSISEDAGDMSIAACADLSRYKRPPAELIAARARKADPVPAYIPEYSGRSFEQICTEHEKLVLQKRLLDARYRNV